jgi:hypothetical protein
MTKETKEFIGCFLAGGIMGLVFFLLMLAPLIQF